VTAVLYAKPHLTLIFAWLMFDGPMSISILMGLAISLVGFWIFCHIWKYDKAGLTGINKKPEPVSCHWGSKASGSRRVINLPKVLSVCRLFSA
jgi:hypothetical protein